MNEWINLSNTDHQNIKRKIYTIILNEKQFTRKYLLIVVEVRTEEGSVAVTVVVAEVKIVHFAKEVSAQYRDDSMLFGVILDQRTREKRGDTFLTLCTTRRWYALGVFFSFHVDSSNWSWSLRYFSLGTVLILIFLVGMILDLISS
jgi:hypothetical protein